MKTSQQKRLDSLWRTVGKADANCEICVTLSTIPDSIFTRTLEAHHIFGRRNEYLRYDLDNRIFVCTYHHTVATQNVQTNLGKWFFNINGNNDWMQKYKPEQKARIIDKHLNTLNNNSKIDLDEIEKELKNYKLEANKYDRSVESYFNNLYRQ